MFDNSPSAPDTALPEHAPVISADAQHPLFAHHSTPVQLQPIPAGVVAADPAEVEITAISDTEWRIAEHAIEHDDPHALLGFIQVVGTAFEVTSLGRPRERAYFTSFDRATASLRPRGVLA
ncbi:hypothetical protein [Cryobacterium sp.]|jgi:hypothetical protein|uniref:hypothetical protein n=1 Tax=Cryobacterium sp. TaxID=1926290 RepID=UPI00260AC788|nr:hypothetical protein [Cryobacterium sp.]MCU1444980.1 hypothetical protein [Cryobacterium sp.]